MLDLSPTIVAKSNQLNADDLIGSPVTITITEVAIVGNEDQPVAIHYEDDNGKPYLPCKSMRRVLMACWGKDGNTYKGRSMTLWRDPKVKWAGAEVGGIRISHVSDIEKAVTLSLTASSKSKRPYTVKPLNTIKKEPTQEDKTKKLAGEIVSAIRSCTDIDALVETKEKHSDDIESIKATSQKAYDYIKATHDKKLAEFNETVEVEDEEIPI